MDRCMLLFKRKKLIRNTSYLLTIVIFITISYNIGQDFFHTSINVPIQIRVPEKQSIDIEFLNVSNFEGDRYRTPRHKCGTSRYPSSRIYSRVFRSDKILNYLGFLLRSHSLFYCSVPKVATRTILPFITYLHIRDDLLSSSTIQNNSDFKFKKSSNTFNADYVAGNILSLSNNSLKADSSSILKLFLARLTDKNASKVDIWSMYEDKVLPYIRLQTLSDPSKIYSSNFTRAIFVRHPLDRLASAYSDKIGTLKNRTSSYDQIRQKICRQNSLFYLNISQRTSRNHLAKRLSKEINERCRFVIPTFEHFITYMLSTGLRADVHWQPYTKLCQVCLLKYNFIGKYETIEEDLNRFISYLGMKPDEWNKKTYEKTGKTKENYQLLYSNLSQQTICNLKRFYRDDFHLFDYQFEDYLINKKNIDC
ncbi:hypothetical protein I4U23_027758 [Adineta vaga]|nr:hypothetical protein I4U23_027758 [Adineta vaga]